MKAKDLAAMLLQVDPETEVWFTMASGCCGDFEELELAEAMFLDYDPKSVALRVDFHSLPGYKSCIQAGGTIKSDKEYWERFKNDSKGDS